MKAVRLHAYGDIDQFRYEEVPDPVPGPGEVLVKVAASTLNPVEIWLRQGFLAQMMPLALPAILGVDVAGTVVQVGPEIAGYRAGDRVVGKLPIDSKGSNAELVATEPKYLAKLPETIGFTEGVALPVAGLTGRQAVDSLGVKAGDRVLVTGALGAVGRAAVQYLEELGAVPVAGVRSARVGEAKALGIEAFPVDEPGAGMSFAAAVETIGGAITAAAIGLVRDGGALASVAGLPEGANADGRIRIVSVYAVEDAAMLRKVVDAAATGTLKIPVAKTFRLSEVGEAHRLMAAGQVGGKIVLIP